MHSLPHTRRSHVWFICAKKKKRLFHLLQGRGVHQPDDTHRVPIFHNKLTVAHSQHERRALDIQRSQDQSLSAFPTGDEACSPSIRPFYWRKACIFCKASNKGRHARQRIDARQNQRAESRLLTSFPSPEHGEADRAVADTRSSRERWEGIFLSDPQRETHTQSRMTPPSSLVGQPGAAKNEVSGHPKVTSPFSFGDEARSSGGGRNRRGAKRVTEKQHQCTLRSPKWGTIDETPLEGRTLAAAPSKKIRVTETCTCRCERNCRGTIGDSFTLQSGNAKTRSPMHRKPPAC